MFRFYARGKTAKFFTLFLAGLALGRAGTAYRMVQHETDHLDGHVYLDRLEKEERREAMRYMRTHRK